MADLDVSLLVAALRFARPGADALVTTICPDPLTTACTSLATSWPRSAWPEPVIVTVRSFVLAISAGCTNPDPDEPVSTGTHLTPSIRGAEDEMTRSH